MPKPKTSLQGATRPAVPSRRRWREKDARRVLKAWGRSGLSASAFARSLGVDAQRLLWWRKRLKIGTEKQGAHDGGSPRSSALTLIPTTVVSTAPSASVTVRLPRRVRIDITEPGLVSPAWIAELLAEIRRVAP
jgi:hypothetical protein